MDDKVEFVLHHEFQDVVRGNTKTAQWVSTQLYSIRYLDGGVGEAENSITKKQVANQMETLSRDLYTQKRNQPMRQPIQNTLNDTRNVVQIKLLMNNAKAGETENIPDKSNVLHDTTSSLPSSNGKPHSKSEKVHLTKRAIVRAKARTDPEIKICKICKATFETVFERKKHQLIYFGITPFRCKHCFHSFAYSSTFYSHTCVRGNYLSGRIPHHQSSVMLRCKLCQKMVQGLDRLIIHETSHTGQILDVSETEKASSKLQYTKNYSNKESSSFCKQCQKEYKNENFLSMHQQIHKFDGRKDVDDKTIEMILLTALDSSPVDAALTDDVITV